MRNASFSRGIAKLLPRRFHHRSTHRNILKDRIKNTAPSHIRMRAFSIHSLPNRKNITDPKDGIDRSFRSQAQPPRIHALLKTSPTLSGKEQKMKHEQPSQLPGIDEML